MNCWETLRADTRQHSEQSQVRPFEKLSDWAISSQAAPKGVEGSTTRASTLSAMYASMNTRQMAAELGVSPKTVARWLEADGIAKRKPGQTIQTKKLDSRLWLFVEYVIRNKSAEVLAKQCGVMPRTVVELLRRHRIQVRTTNKGRKFPELVGVASARNKGKFLKENNPNWKGGVSTIRDVARGSYRYKKWSSAVKKRDDYKCCECGSADKPHAHHVKPWRSFPELRYDVSNGKTLCEPCHIQAHAFTRRRGKLHERKAPVKVMI